LPAAGTLPAGAVQDGPVDDLVTNDSFGNFELELEWKIGKVATAVSFTGDARLRSRLLEWSGISALDDANAPDGKSRLTAAAAAYALYGAPAGIVLPFDQWNKTRSS